MSMDEGFQKTYENFYTLGRYPKEFRRDYFAYMERCKETGLSFEEALSYFLKYGTLEVSFSSKLVHTLDPEQPIWDRNVTDRHFGYKIPACGTKLIILLYNFHMVYWLGSLFLRSGINGRIICIQRKGRDDF